MERSTWRIDHLHRSFCTALVALRLRRPPETPSVRAGSRGDLIGLLADLSEVTDLPDVDSFGDVMAHPWGEGTLDALVRAVSVRQAARLT